MKSVNNRDGTIKHYMENIHVTAFVGTYQDSMTLMSNMGTLSLIMLHVAIQSPAILSNNCSTVCDLLKYSNPCTYNNTKWNYVL